MTILVTEGHCHYCFVGFLCRLSRSLCGLKRSGDDTTNSAKFKPCCSVQLISMCDLDNAIVPSALCVEMSTINPGLIVFFGDFFFVSTFCIETVSILLCLRDLVFSVK